MTSREKLSAVDSAWLRMDKPGRPMSVVSVLVFDAPVEFARLRAAVAHGLLAHQRFRQRVVLDGYASWWENHANFDLDAHLCRAALPAPAGQAELQRFVGNLLQTPLDTSRPLWDMHCLQTYRQGSALVVRIHNCIADGVALMRVMLDMADQSPFRASDASQLLPLVERRRVARQADAENWHGSGDGPPQFDTAAADWLAEQWSQLTRPGTCVDGVGARPPVADKSGSRANSGQGAGLCVGWSDALPLTDVKRAALAAGGTVNDVLLACVAGALGAHIRQGGATWPASGALRTLVPVNLRSPRVAGELGNHFGLVGVDLPLDLAAPAARMAAVKRRMDAIKRSAWAPASYALLGLAGCLPQPAQYALLELITGAAGAITANLPGPRERLHLAGAGIERMMFWMPQPGGVRLGVSLLSYDGKVQVGLAADSDLLPDAQAVAELFGPQLRALLADLPAAQAAAGIANSPLVEKAARGKPSGAKPTRRKAGLPAAPSAARPIMLAPEQPLASPAANRPRRRPRPRPAGITRPASPTPPESGKLPAAIYTLDPRNSSLTPRKPSR